jgi:ubiquinone/menaquinone biosynthesis C-methylase UbiE
VRAISPTQTDGLHPRARSTPAEFDYVAFYEEEARQVERYGSPRFWDARYHRTRMKAIERVLRRALRPGDRFMDAGCGAGEYLAVALSAGAEAIGADLARAYLLRANGRFGAVRLLQADVTHLPLRAKSLDVLLCSEVIEHLPNPEAALAELARVGKRVALITTPNFGAMRVVAGMFLRAQMEELDRSVGHISVFPLGELCRKIEASGWRLLSVRTLHIAPPAVTEALRLPPWLSPLVRAAEALFNLLLPRAGNASILLCERSPRRELTKPGPGAA